MSLWHLSSNRYRIKSRQRYLIHIPLCYSIIAFVRNQGNASSLPTNKPLTDYPFKTKNTEQYTLLKRASIAKLDIRLGIVLHLFYILSSFAGRTLNLKARLDSGTLTVLFKFFSWEKHSQPVSHGNPNVFFIFWLKTNSMKTWCMLLFTHKQLDLDLNCSQLFALYACFARIWNQMKILQLTSDIASVIIKLISIFCYMIWRKLRRQQFYLLSISKWNVYAMGWIRSSCIITLFLMSIDNHNKETTEYYENNCMI